MTDPTYRAPRAPIQPGRMPFTVLLDEAMRRTRRHFRAIFPAVAFPLALLAVVTVVLQALWIRNMPSADDMAAVLLWFFKAMLLGLFQGIVTGIGLVALQKAAVDATAGRPVDMKEAWQFALRPPVVGTFLLYVLLIFVSMMLCFFPFLYVAPLLSLVPVIMAEEKVYGGAALSRSAALTRYNPEGDFFKTPLVKALALMVVTIVISYAVAFLVVLPLQLPMLVSMFRNIAAGKDPAMTMEMSKRLWTQVPSQILQVLTTVAVYLYSSFGYALLFFDARSRKEGSDLAAEIQTVFGSGPAGT
jgi:hypothetical protein